MSYFLDSTDYTLKNALLWGNFHAHLKKAGDSGLTFGRRFVHLIFAALELFPVASQIISFVELYYFRMNKSQQGAHSGPGKDSGTSIGNGKADIFIKTTPATITLNKTIDAGRIQSKEGLTAGQLSTLEDIYSDFFDHFAEYLVYCATKERAPPFYHYKKSKDDCISQLQNLPIPIRFYWDYWSAKPDEFVKIFHTAIGRSSYIIREGKKIGPPISSKPYIRQDDMEHRKFQAMLFDDGTLFFNYIIDRPHEYPQPFIDRISKFHIPKYEPRACKS